MSLALAFPIRYMSATSLIIFITSNAGLISTIQTSYINYRLDTVNNLENYLQTLAFYQLKV
jgi:hypothetical protein